MMDSAVLATIAGIVAEETGGLDVQLQRETTADEVAGWDSVAHSRIMLRIEEVFEIRVAEDKMYSFENVGELVDYVALLKSTPGGESSAHIDRREEKDAAEEPSALETDRSTLLDELAPLDERPPSAKRDPVFNLFSMARYPAPYSMFHDRPADRPGGIDRFGFLNASPPDLPKPEEEKRVFVFGNSVIRGGDIVNGIQAYVDANGRPDIRVYNFGAISSISIQSLMYFVWQGMDLAPDLVITFDGYSDLGAQAVGYDPRPGYPYNHYMYEVVHEYLGRGEIGALDFPRAERERRDILRKQVGWKTPEWREELALSYLNCVQKFHEICASYGIAMHSYLQPTLAWKKNLIGMEKKRALKEIIAHARHTFTLARRGYSTLQQTLGTPKNRFTDLSAMFEEEEVACFSDMVHLEKESSRKVSERLAKDVLEMV
jgi:acyl carrier protein